MMNNQKHLHGKSIDKVLGNPPGTSNEIDNCMAILLSNPRNFAALFNSLHIFQDKILPEDLAEMDSRLSVLRFKDYAEIKKKGQTLYRDNLKIWKGRIPVCLGAENESKADPTMAIRILNYEAINYERQVAAIQARNEWEWSDGEHIHYPEELTAGEKLSRFKKKDKLYPVFTAILFTGDTWDCATNLNEMFTIPDNFMKWIPSWPLCLIDPHQMDDDKIMDMDSNDMKFFMSMVKYSKDKKKMKEISQKYFSQFYVSPQAAYITGVVAKIDWMEEKYEDRKDETKESVNMCLAMDEWENEAMSKGEARGIVKGREEGRVEGKAEGRVEGITEERQKVVLYMHSNGFSADKIAEMLGIDIEEVKDILSQHRA